MPLMVARRGGSCELSGLVQHDEHRRESFMAAPSVEAMAGGARRNEHGAERSKERSPRTDEEELA